VSDGRRRGVGGRLVVGALTLAACVWLAAWGCASQAPVAAREHDWRRYVPDGGWANFVPPPSRSEYEPEPSRAAAGESRVFPVLPSLDIH